MASSLEKCKLLNLPQRCLKSSINYDDVYAPNPICSLVDLSLSLPKLVSSTSTCHTDSQVCSSCSSLFLLQAAIPESLTSHSTIERYNLDLQRLFQTTLSPLMVPLGGHQHYLVSDNIPI